MGSLPAGNIPALLGISKARAGETITTQQYVDPFEAVNAPRFANYLHEDSFDPDSVRSNTIDDPPGLEINQEVDSTTIEDLLSRGHIVRKKKGAIGVPAIALIDRDGTMYAATDTKTGHEVSASK